MTIRQSYDTVAEDYIRFIYDELQHKPLDRLLLAAVHLGDSTLHLDEWWGHEVSVDFHFFGTAE